MFGQNKIVKQQWNDGLSLRVHSIFPTIQGEGPWAGSPAIFIRLSDCCLRCYWCDQEFESGTLLSVFDVLKRVGEVAGECETHLVVITGGEPFVQNFIPLVDMLTSTGGFTVQIETCGILWVPEGFEEFEKCARDLHINSKLQFVVSPKTGSVHPVMAAVADAWKYIVAEGDIAHEDGLPLMSTQVPGKVQPVARPGNNDPVYIQPRDDQDPEKNARNTSAAVRVAMKYGYRVSLQLHKLLGLP